MVFNARSVRNEEKGGGETGRNKRKRTKAATVKRGRKVIRGGNHKGAATAE